MSKKTKKPTLKDLSVTSKKSARIKGGEDSTGSTSGSTTTANTGSTGGGSSTGGASTGGGMVIMHPPTRG